MPSIQSRSAFGSGSRQLGPPSLLGSRSFASAAPAEAALRNKMRNGTETPPWQPEEKTSKWAAPAPSGAPSAAPSTAPSTAPALAPAPASVEAGPGWGWRDAFRPSGKSTSTSETGGSKFRAAVEAERWRSKLSGASNPPKKDEKLEAYHQPAQADWARERLLGSDAPSAEELEKEEEELRQSRTVGQAWVETLSAWVEVGMIARLEDMLRRRLGELESSSAHAGRVARQFFSECDPNRSGRIHSRPFIETVGRKLNYDFAARGSTPSSQEVLRALFERYDLERSGCIPADDFHAALVGSSRDGRASGRVVNAIGRLREGLVRSAGGYDALRMTDARWYATQKAEKHPTGCLPAGAFVDGLSSLAELAGVTLSDADLNVIVETFEPPPETLNGKEADADEPYISYDEFTRAVRGPPMNSARVALVRAAHAALKEDANKKDVRPTHLAERYNVKRHPAVVSGDLGDEQAAMAFLQPWKDALDEEVTLKEFADRYEWISPLFDSDDDFEWMMRTAWRLK